MRFSLVIALVVAIIAVVFALQNPDPVDVSLGPFDLTGSAALVILITFVLGVAVGVLASLPSIYRRQKTIKHLKRGDTPGSIAGLSSDATASETPTPHV